MIPWGWAVLAFVAGCWFGLLIAGLLRAAADVDLPQRREGTE